MGTAKTAKSKAPARAVAKRKARPTTIAEYIRAAPAEAQPHLRKLQAILKRAAPKATQTIKWGNPFFVEPRYLYAYSAHKAHLSFAPSIETMDAFRAQFKPYKSTKYFLQIRYDQPLPADLLRRMAEYRAKFVAAREDDGFW